MKDGNLLMTENIAKRLKSRQMSTCHLESY